MWRCHQSNQTSLSGDAQGDFATRRENNSANKAAILLQILRPLVALCYRTNTAACSRVNTTVIFCAVDETVTVKCRVCWNLKPIQIRQILTVNYTSSELQTQKSRGEKRAVAQRYTSGFWREPRRRTSSFPALFRIAPLV